MQHFHILAGFGPLLCVLIGCGNPGHPAPAKDSATPGKHPDHITVDHILIGVKERGTRATRSAGEARALAYKLVELIRGGADWDELKSKYSDDRGPRGPGGPYAIANKGVTPRKEIGEVPRTGMVSAFGDVGFGLAVGEIGVADFTPDGRASPYGYHIIKRTK